MSRSYGAVLAQVIPVIMLAVLLELRAIISTSRVEHERMRKAGITLRSDMYAALVPRSVRRLFGYEPTSGMSLSTLLEQSRRSEEVDRLSPVDSFIFIVCYGILMLLLSRSEMVALAAARGIRVSHFETVLSTAFVVLGLICLTIVPIGLELYANYGGSRWNMRVWSAYVIAGCLAGVLFVVSIVGYLH